MWGGGAVVPEEEERASAGSIFGEEDGGWRGDGRGRGHGGGGDAVAGAHADVVRRHRAHSPRRGLAHHRALHPPAQQCEFPIQKQTRI